MMAEPYVKPILVLDDTFALDEIKTLPAGVFEAVLCLFWTAEETITTLEKQTGARCIPLRCIVDNVTAWEHEAGQKVIEICERGPQWHGLAWRCYLKQPLYQLLLDWFLAKRVCAFVVSEASVPVGGGMVLELVVGARLAAAFQLLAPQLIPQCVLKIRAQLPGTTPAPRWKRLVRRTREVMLSGGWRLQAWHLLAELDREYVWRMRWHNKPSATFLPGAVTLFSSYSNNSRTESAFAPLLPEPVQWLFTNWSAREGAENSAQPKGWLWEFAPAQITDALPRDDAPDTGDPALDEWIGQSAMWHSWSEYELTALAQLTRCWQHYLETYAPRLVVMADSWGLDGWFTRVARRYDLTVLHLLHGAIGGDFYTNTSIEADGLVVWGEFWRDLWRADQHEKIVVTMPPGLFPRVRKRPASKRRLVFFSWDVTALAQYNQSELASGLMDVLHTLAQTSDMELTVRFHPAENPSDFVRRWRACYGALPGNLRLSKREPLNELIAETDVALMYRSTVLMNCLVNEIPVVMPGWIDFAWNEQLGSVEGIYLATGFDDLKRQLAAWLEHPPKMDPGMSKRFAARDRDSLNAFYERVRLNLPGKVQ